MAQRASSTAERKRETLIAEGWRPERVARGEWWYYKSVGQGWRFEDAWKHRAELRKALGKPPQQPNAKLEAAREAVIRAAKAWAQPLYTTGDEKRLVKAVARLEKLEAKETRC